MADGVPITAGSGTTILTDDTGAGGHAQVVKLAISTDGSGTLIPADANGMLVNLGTNNDVDVSSVIPGTGATNLGKAEDAAHTTGDVGVMALGVRQDGRAAMAGASGDYIPLSINAEGELRVQTFDPGTIDTFGSLITGSINNAVDVQFYRDTPANLTTVTLAGTGTANASGGMATFTTGASAGGTSKGVSLTSLIYTGGAEVYGLFTAAFTGTGGTSTFQRIGLYDTNNGFYVGFEGTTFGITVRTGAADTQTAKASFNIDTLTGAASSGFTRAGVPEAIDLTKLNVWRIRFGWVGSAPITFDVLSPDGHWVPFHVIRQPNLAAVPHIQNADLPVTCNVSNAAVATTLAVLTNCWVAGTTQRLSKLSATLTDNTLAELNRAVITGVTTGGGGGYVNVKVSPSGAMTVDGTVAVSSIASVPSHAVTNAGTFATQVDGSALTALQLIDDPVFADDAAFTVGTSKVAMAGVQAVAHGSTPDTADALDATALIANRHRIPFMLGGHPNLQSSEYFTSGAVTDDNILPAISAGTIYVITGITVTCSAANVTNPSVRIGFGAASVPAQGTTNADAVAKVLLSHPGIPAGSGVVKGHNGGIVGIGGDGEELRVTCTTPTTSMVIQVDWFSISS